MFDKIFLLIFPTGKVELGGSPIREAIFTESPHNRNNGDDHENQSIDDTT